MTPERWRRLEALFEAALERDPASRAAFVAAACGSDTELQQELENVLRSHDLLSVGSTTRGTLHAGARLGRYEIVSLLGAGGMGEVYRARDPQLGREVGIKILPSRDEVSGEQLKRFEREARAVGALKHSNILTVYDIGVERGVPYVVSELLEGETLRSRLNRGPIPVEETLDVAFQIVSGLTAAHAKDLVHRDIKPENLFITTEGTVKILDFGLAKHTGISGAQTAATATAITEQGLVVGTAAYMSPEQARGQHADTRSDVFAFGVVLYEMLAGTRPFGGESSVETLNAILTREPPPLAPALPAALQRIVQTCLAKDPHHRYASTRALLTDVDDARRSWTTTTTRIAARPAPRRGRVAAVVAALVLVITAVAVLVWWNRPRPLPPGASGRPSLAVMPLDDRTGDPALAWLAEGLPRMIVTSLAQTPGVDVIGSERLTASFNELGRDGPAPPRTRVAKHAGAGALLAGTLVKIGSDVRIDVQVEDVDSGRVVAAGSEQGPDVFVLVDRLTTRIRAALDVTDRPAGRPLRDVTTSALAAYELYVKGLDAWHNRRWSDARTIFEEAVRIDPSFALAHAQLALVLDRLGEVGKAAAHRNLVMHQLDRLPERQRLMAEAKHASATDLPRARVLLEQVMARYPDEEDAYDEMVHTLSSARDPSRANETLGFLQRWEKAIPGPGSGHFHNHYGYALIDHGLFTEAEREFRAYIRVSPNEANPYDSLAELFLITGRPADAIRYYDEALRINPLFGASYFGRAYASAMLGQYEDAVASLVKLEELGARSGLPVTAVQLASAFIRARAGRYREADSFVATALQIARDAGDAAGEVESYLIDATLAIERGQTAHAREVMARLERAIVRAPSGAVTLRHTNLARFVALAARDPAAAEHALRSTEDAVAPSFGTRPVLVVLSCNLPFRDAEARALAARGDTPAALAAYHRLNQPDITGKRPSLFEPRFVLARARLADRIGDRATAEAEYTRFLDLWKHADAGLPEVAEARKRLRQ